MINKLVVPLTLAVLSLIGWGMAGYFHASYRQADDALRGCVSELLACEGYGARAGRPGATHLVVTTPQGGRPVEIALTSDGRLWCRQEF